MNCNNVFVDYAESLPSTEVSNVVGVKGRSAFCSIIDDLPITAPVDYMPCVLLGNFTETLKLCVNELSSNLIADICHTVLQLSFPKEMISISRKIRPLSELAQFKANELYNWLLYVCPVVFFGRLSDRLYSHVCNLSFGIRLLIESSSKDNVNIAEQLLGSFCREVSEIHNDERAETINVQSVSHLAEQVERFGPLFCFSAMSCEAANRTLGEVFSGSNSECEVICRRILQRHKLNDSRTKDEQIRAVVGRMLNSKLQNNGHFSQDMIETESLRFGRQLYPEAFFYNRATLNGVYYDSRSYGKYKNGNCFVSFVENESEIFGEIQYFMTMPGPPFYEEMMANVQYFSVTECIGKITGFIYRLKETDCENLLPLQELKKVFFLQGALLKMKKISTLLNFALFLSIPDSSVKLMIFCQTK